VLFQGESTLPGRELHGADIFSLMMCQSAEDLRHQAQWDGARGDSRTQLLSELSSTCRAFPL
jgi:hypothetical protein